jgi:hypothetical protein
MSSSSSRHVILGLMALLTAPVLAKASFIESLPAGFETAGRYYCQRPPGQPGGGGQKCG